MLEWVLNKFRVFLITSGIILTQLEYCISITKFLNVQLHVSNVILVVPHKPYESCFAFLFEVYVKQSQICNTFPTSKMELFVIKRICKVISCRLMILYTQYCPKSEMVLFVAITITNVVFYREMVLHTKFVPMNFLFFVLVRC